MYKNALVTVSDKTGLVEFLEPLIKQGLRVVSTGGTAEFLKSHKLPVTDVQDQTQFPEVLSGRVKTLHPYIHMPLLARSWKPEDQEVLKKYQLSSFDLVICNLYPFEKHQETQEDQDLVEWIDVGGPSLLRASAKNFFTVTTLCSPLDYSRFQKGTTLEERKQLASKVFDSLSRYDSLIAQRLKAAPKDYVLKGGYFKSLRYGENPHQKSSWYAKPDQQGLHQAKQLQGKDLSFNNLLDFSNGIHALREFKETCCVAIKHNNPCGVACGKDVFSSISRALEADPLSVFGGVLAVNGVVDKKSAQKITEIFLEGVIAPDFSQEALELLKTKKNLRVLKWKDLNAFKFENHNVKNILGGFLVQDQDPIISHDWQADWKIIGETPTDKIKKDLIFAWKVCSHLKSNAISLVKDQQTIGLGMGQVNRVDALKLSIDRVRQFHPHKKENLVLASDAFFPFSDSIDQASQAGIQWIIQPGGSIKDEEVLQKSQDLGMNMILTGRRHFKH
ncbi:MAG: bifunctional phosphoribosylaminoimidazolecarboxamide formyltransferase/IMP cyclohydrolase [Bdellovibrionales bacterium]